MFSQDDDGQQGLAVAVVLGVVAFVIVLVIALAIGSGVDLRSSSSPVLATAPTAPAAMATPEAEAPPPASPEPAASSVSAALAAQAAADAASVKIEQGVVKFYFASGNADLAAGAGEALVGVVRAAGSGRKLVVSGFHDATGDAARNAGLARQRALAVRDALQAAGVPAQQIELRKPEQLTGSGSDAEARRVEISVE